MLRRRVHFALAAAIAIAVVGAPRAQTPDRRVVAVVIDDWHVEFALTPKLRDVVRQVGQLLIRDGDLYSVVSTGYSSIQEEMTDDRSRLSSAVVKTSGSAFKVSELTAMIGARPEIATEEQRRTSITFATLRDILQKLSLFPDRRKTVVYISGGSDFDAIAKAAGPSAVDDLRNQLMELTRQAKGMDVRIDTIDPRGLDVLPGAVTTPDRDMHVRNSQDFLKVLATQTGGIAVFDRGKISSLISK